MDPPDNDIQFDFFEEEPVTAEAVGARGRPTRRGGRRPPGLGTPPHSLKPLLKLLGLVASVIFLVLVFALLIESCAGQSKHDLYGNYMAKVDTIASQSSADGQRTVAAFTTPGLSVPNIVQKLNTIASQEQQNVAAAQSLAPPGKLRAEHANLIQALQLRVSGVQGLSLALHSTVGSKANPNVLAGLLTKQVYRLLASDVVWDDLFQAPSVAVLTKEGVHQVTVPSSHFLLAPDLIITDRAWMLILARINGTQAAGSCSGLHGTNISAVAALPNGTGGKTQVLNSGSLNTVATSTNLAFQVTIYNGGDSQEVQIPVTLTLPQSQGGPVTRTGKVQLIDPQHYATVVFPDLGSLPFDSPANISVDVARVPCEVNIANNSAQYKVLFTLPS
jgi:hypothetical protein